MADQPVNQDPGTQPGDQPPEPKPLPDGFDPKEFGLPSPDEWKSAQTVAAERDDYKKRAEDNQRAYHDNQTLFAQKMQDQEKRYTDLAEEVRRGARPQAPKSQELFARFNQTKDPVDYYAAMDARTNEIVEERLSKFQPAEPKPAPQIDLDAFEERLRYKQSKESQEVPTEDLERAFVPTLGGKPPSLLDYNLLYRVRKAGGWDKFNESLGKTAVENYRKSLEAKKQRGTLPEIPDTTTANEPGIPDLQQMSTPEFVAKFGTPEAKAQLAELEGK